MRSNSRTHRKNESWGIYPNTHQVFSGVTYVVPSKGTILIVDDSPDDVQLLLRSFNQVGVQNPVQICTGGDEALKYLVKNWEDPPALVLLDLKMPGTDGFHVLSKVKTNPALKDIIVIVLTTSAEIGDIQLSYELGANSFLTKPLDLAEFREMVAAFHNYWVINNQAAPKRGRWVRKPGTLDPAPDSDPAASSWAE